MSIKSVICKKSPNLLIFLLLVFQISTAPPPEEFYKDFVRPSKAAIFRNVLSDTKAFKLWDADYIVDNYGEMEVRLEGKKEKVTSFDHFLFIDWIPQLTQKKL